LTADLSYNALLRNTVSITGLAGSDQTHVIPAVARASVDVRLLLRQDPEAFLAELVRVVGDTGIAITVQGPTCPRPRVRRRRTCSAPSSRRPASARPAPS